MIERREREGEREKERKKERYREGGRDKREREREWEWGERDREVKGIERWKSLRESKILVNSPRPRNKAQTKVDYTKLSLQIITQNYYTKLSPSILCRAKVGELKFLFHKI